MRVRLGYLLALALVAMAPEARAGEELVLIGPLPGACVPDAAQPPVKHPKDLTVEQLVEAYSHATCKQYLVSKAVLKRRMNIIASTSPGDPDERLESLLEAHELTAGQRVYQRIDHFTWPDPTRDAEVSTPVPSPPPPPPPPVDLRARCTAKACKVSRARVEEQLADLNGLATQARIIPRIKDGKPNGFKFYAIRPRSVFAQLGFENGDTLLSVNGVALTDPSAALDAYTSLRSASRFTVEIERRDAKRVIEIELTSP